MEYNKLTENIYQLLENELQDSEINIDDYEKMYKNIEYEFSKSLKKAMGMFEKNKKIFINAYDKNGKKLYVGDKIIYYRRKRSLQPADFPEFDGEMPHGKDEFGQDLYYYTDKIYKLKGYINNGNDDYAYDKGWYVSLMANGGYRPAYHQKEEKVIIGKKENGRNIYEYKRTYLDIETMCD